MIKRIGVFCLVLLFAAPVVAETIYYAPQVTGKRERKNIRHFLYLKNLTGDMKAVYDEYGYTPHRIRLNGYGTIRQEWTYYEAGKVFVFDQCSNLVETPLGQCGAPPVVGLSARRLRLRRGRALRRLDSHVRR